MARARKGFLPPLRTGQNEPQIRIRNNSEALFKTLKYGPEFPECFASVHDAPAAYFCQHWAHPNRTSD